jgi:hypothetical protein
MTGDLPGPDQRAAEQAYEAAARLYEQAAAELDRAAAHCAWPPPSSEGPRCRGGRRRPGRRWGISANCGWRSRLVPTASRCAPRACVEDHLRPVTGGTDGSRWRRLGSPQSSREVPAETQEEPAGTGRGTGHGGRIGVRGVRRPLGVVAGNRGVRSGRWRCRSGARSPTARDPSAPLPGPLRHGRSGPGLSRTRHAHRPALPEPAPAVHPLSVKGKLAALVPSGPLTVGRWCAGGSSRTRASC